jgi:cobalt-zinc-cadmium efflux system outer membrane protein
VQLAWLLPEVTVVWKPYLHALLLGCVTGVVTGTTVTAQTSPPPPATRTDWTLDDVLTAALAQHPLVEAARADVGAAEGSRQTATAFPNPVATYWTENAPFPGQDLPSGLDRESSVYATLPLEPFWQRRSRLAQVNGEVRAAQAAVTSTEQHVALDAARAFYRVALAQASVEAVRENGAAVEQLVSYLRARVAQGANPEGDLIRAEVERDRVDTDVTLAEVDLLRAQAALRPFLGDTGPALAALRVTGLSVARESVSLAPLNEFAAHAVQQRADLITGRAKVDAAAAAIAVERSLVVRQLGATLGVKRTAGTNAMVAGISLTVPLFDRNRGEIQRATGERLAAEQELRWLDRTIKGEIEGAYQAAQRLVAQVAAVQPTALSRAEESRRIALAAYQEGAATLLQVLDASRALTDARLTVARLVVAANESIFELGVAAGYGAQAAARLGRSPSPRPEGGSR